MNTPRHGNRIPDAWPPRTIDPESRDPLPVPYLDKPPEVIALGTGRELFVDDFLIESTDLVRTYHQPTAHPASPVLQPESELERNRDHCPMAAPFNDGVWYDPHDQLFKMWYHAGWFDGTALAVSTDGLNWQRPSLDVIPGTNAVIAPAPGHRRDGALVWLDHDAPADQRYKLFLYTRRPDGQGGRIAASPDGIHWEDRGTVSPCGDNTSFFYNPFRKRYVFSIRDGWPFRARAYHEGATLEAAGRWGDGEPVPWARTDRLDQPEPTIGDEPQLYDLNAVAYESIMLGAFAVFHGPQNPVCARTGHVKIIDVQMAYSRDGFHWHRPDRRAFIPCTRRPGDWNRGYIHAAGGVCLVVGDELWFYFAAFSGESPQLAPGQTGAFEQANAMYAGASTGLAVLRRDGFASMDAGPAGGTLTTRPVTFTGKHLFVNTNAVAGELSVEILTSTGNPIAPFIRAACQPVTADTCKHQITWKGDPDLTQLTGQPVRFRLHLRDASLYALWVSESPEGISNGYVAAGGPGFDGPRDT